MKGKIMRHRISFAAVVCVLLCGVSVVQAQNKPDSTTAKIMALENKWNEAYLKGDVAVLNSMLPDDFIITVEDGSTYSKPGYIAHSKDSTVHVEVAEISDVKIRMHGSIAVVTGAYHEKGTSKGKPYEYHDRYTDVWQKTGGNWQLIASQFAVPSKD